MLYPQRVQRTVIYSGKIDDIITLEQRLKSLSDKRLPIMAAYAIARNLDALQKITSAYENTRLALLEQYSERDENGELIIDENGNARVKDTAPFLAELQRLLGSEEKIELMTIPYSELERCDGEGFDALTVSDIQALGPMIEEDADAE